MTFHLTRSSLRQQKKGYIPGVKSGTTEYDLEESFFKTYIGGAIAVARGFDDVRVIFWYDN